MKILTAPLVDPTHGELSQPLAVPLGASLQIAIPEEGEEEHLWRDAAKTRTARGDDALQAWAASRLLRPSWVRLARIACLEKRDMTRRLGRLRAPDHTTLRQLWHTVSAVPPPPA